MNNFKKLNLTILCVLLFGSQVHSMEPEMAPDKTTQAKSKNYLTQAKEYLHRNLFESGNIKEGDRLYFLKRHLETNDIKARKAAAATQAPTVSETVVKKLQDALDQQKESINNLPENNPKTTTNWVKEFSAENIAKAIKERDDAKNKERDDAKKQEELAVAAQNKDTLIQRNTTLKNNIERLDKTLIDINTGTDTDNADQVNYKKIFISDAKNEYIHNLLFKMQRVGTLVDPTFKPYNNEKAKETDQETLFADIEKDMLTHIFDYQAEFNKLHLKLKADDKKLETLPEKVTELKKIIPNMEYLTETQQNSLAQYVTRTMNPFSY
ncbi:MAG: hypothetical protein NTU89_01160 [Candidatus Dependentiae bacterium]|nr:hypothetical protein [Candidatus Dependentiae bacterium]